MAPWPEQGNEPKAPDKSCSKSGENSCVETAKVDLGATEDTDVNAATNKCDDKQAEDRNADVSNLDDGQLRALLDEAITYKCPKDREGKSNLFRELLQEAEADETECSESRRGALSGVGGSRYYSNSSRRRGRRDAQVSERQTRGGSLQNLVQASNSEFDPAAGFSGYHCGGNKNNRKSKRSSTGGVSFNSSLVGGSGGGRDCGGVSVSARQREGGSLPSNVNVGGMLTLSGLDYQTNSASLAFEDIKYCKQTAAKRKEFTHSASSNEFTSMPVQASTINSSSSGGGSLDSSSAALTINSNCVISKSDCMVIDLGDYVDEDGGERSGAGNGIGVSNTSSNTNTDVGHACAKPEVRSRKKSASECNGSEEDGVELEVLQRTELTTRVLNYTSHATLEVGHGETKRSLQGLSASGSSEAGADVDSVVTFPLEGLQQCNEKPNGGNAVNGIEQNPLQLPSSYNSVKCIMGPNNTSSLSREDKLCASKSNDVAKRSSGSEAAGKTATSAANAANPASVMHSMYPMQHLSVLSLPPNGWIAAPIGTGKPDCLRAASIASERACLRASLASVTSEKHESSYSGSYSGYSTWYTEFLTLSNRPPREDVNRLTFHGSSKDCSGETKNKSLDENGNAVNRLDASNSNSNERKGKQRKTKTNNDRNVIMSQNIEGHRGDKDIDTLLKFIESNSDGKGTKTKSTTSHSNGPVSFSSKQQRNCSRLLSSGTKPRRERGTEEQSEEDSVTKTRTGTGKQVIKEHRGKGSKLKKSNSLEEISKTKLEDLTSASKAGSEGPGSIGIGGNVEEGSTSVLVRRPKKQTTLDNGEFYSEKARVGDRRSWGTEEGQQYYCNDGVTVSADESSSGSVQNNRKRRGNAIVPGVLSDEKRKGDRDEGVSVTSLSAASGASEETEFHVVTKRQRRKKRRSSSGGRGTSASTGGSLFDDNWRPSYNNYSTYYQSRDNGGSSYYPRKTFTSSGGGFPPHDRTVEHDNGGVVLYQYRHHRPRSPDHLRRKSTSSMPPSDKSDSSDLDSVHSLPVSSTTPKLTLDQTSTSSGSTPQASYADIARMASANAVSSGPAHPHNYTNINLNASRWPVMGMPKTSVVATSSGNATSGCISAAVSVPISSSSVVTTVVNSNPQFITGPKLNIGVPPVSGSKVSSVSAHISSTVQPTASLVIPLNTNAAFEDLSGSEGRSCGPEQVLTGKQVTSFIEICTKKDAMTNTNLDFNTGSPSSLEVNSPNPQPQGTNPKPAQTTPVNLLLDGEYPSLEESLLPEKSKTKSGHSHSNPMSSALAMERSNPIPTNAPIPVVSCNNNNTGQEESTRVHQSETNDMDKENNGANETRQPVTESVSSPQECSSEGVDVPGSSSVPTTSVAADVKPNEPVVAKPKNTSKKSSRPPVIIMDENEEPFSFNEGVATASELTFGFEINEQLLMSESLDENGEDMSTTVEAVESPVPVEESRVTVSPVATVATLSSVGDDFSARYRDPPTQPDNHDKIVTFVGLAWDDVVKEMNCMLVQSGGKVQYYSGQ